METATARGYTREDQPFLTELAVLVFVCVGGTVLNCLLLLIGCFLVYQFLYRFNKATANLTDEHIMSEERSERMFYNTNTT